VRYISPSGSDTTGTGTLAAPYATLNKARTSSAVNDSIVVRGGTYTIPVTTNYYFSKAVTIIAYPGEIPVFDGSIAAPSTVTTEGSLVFFSYQPMKAAEGGGMNIGNLETATFSTSGPTGKALLRGWRYLSSFMRFYQALI